MINLLSKELKKSLRVIKNFPNKGINFQDITSITDDPKLFLKVVNSMSTYAKKNNINKVIGIEARGFIFASAVAIKNQIAFVPIRKENKLPGKVFKKKYKLEYGYDEIQIHQNAIKSKDRILVIDDLIATGGTALAAASLIKKFKPKQINFFFIINLYNLKGLKEIKKKFSSKTLIDIEG